MSEASEFHGSPLLYGDRLTIEISEATGEFSVFRKTGRRYILPFKSRQTALEILENLEVPLWPAVSIMEMIESGLSGTHVVIPEYIETRKKIKENIMNNNTNTIVATTGSLVETLTKATKEAAVTGLNQGAASVVNKEVTGKLIEMAGANGLLTEDQERYITLLTPLLAISLVESVPTMFGAQADAVKTKAQEALTVAFQEIGAPAMMKLVGVLKGYGGIVATPQSLEEK